MKKAKRLLAKLLVISMIMNLFSVSSFAVPQGYEKLEPVCMQTEHVHDEKCYVAELNCEKAIASDSNSETLASDSDAEVLASDSNANHVHKETCYTKKLVCELNVHVHGEDCFEVEKNEMLALPNGATVPEGYDMAYLYVDENEQFSVTVYATKDALPEGAKLVAELLDESSDAYAEAAEALEEMPAVEGSDEELLELMEVELTDEELEVFGIDEGKNETDEPENGFVALDIHFELDGEEVEPSESVYVYINALGLIPEEADPDSVAIQHHAEEAEVEQVADNNEDTGVVAVSENEEEKALDVMSAFEVDGFSTFTITWNTNAGKIEATIHYMDTESNELLLDGESEKNILLKNETAYDMNLYHNGINHDGYTYCNSYLLIEGEEVRVTRVTAMNDGRFAYRKNNYVSWTFVPYSEVGGTVDIYLEFAKLDASSAGIYFENPIHDDIKLTLYDYGSYIDYGEDKAIQFGWHDREAEAIDGFPMNHKAADQWHILSNSDIINSGLEYYAPTPMNRTLNEKGFPQISNNARRAAGKSLEYLFRTDGPNLYTGKYITAETSTATNASIKPLTDYSKMREEAVVYRVTKTADGKDHFSYNSNFESMRFDVNGDGGLFTLDEDGYYVYDSSEMSAYYDQEKGRFQLSNMLIGPSHYGLDYFENVMAFGMNFMPFDKIHYDAEQQKVTSDLGTVITLPNSDNKQVYVTPYFDSLGEFASKEEELQYKREVSNMFFGMVMEIDFYVPKNGQIDGEDMVFEFSGDDDVWVYLDDVMVLDLGGTHAKADGTINFATGEVVDGNSGGTYSTKLRTLKSTFEEAAVQDSTVSFDGFDGVRFADYTKHTLKFFYMERGGNISYCKLRFNMPTLPEKSLTVTKELEVEDENETTDMVKNALTYEFRVLQTDENGNATGKLLIEEGEKYTILKEGKPIGEGTVGEDGYFGLRAGEAAQFDDMLERAEKAGYTNLEEAEYVVEERLPDNVSGIYNGVEYDVFGMENTIKKEDGSIEGFTTYQTAGLEADEAQIVTYRNQVKTEALRHLRITKVDEGKTGPERQDVYQIKLLVCSDGENPDQFEPISIGTEYKIVGVNEPKTVTKAGIIELKAGETAELRVLPGTQYKVREERNNDYQYYDTYKLFDSEHPNGLELGQMESDEYYASGTFESELEAGECLDEKVEITNNYYLNLFKVVVNYFDKETGAKIAESYIDSRIEEFSPYDVTDKDKIVIAGYDYDSTTGDALKSESMDSDKVINVYYTKIPKFDLIVNYFDKETGEKIAVSYEENDIVRDTAYDVSDKDDEVVIAGYDYDSTTGDALTGVMDADKVINVYFTKTEEPTTEEPTTEEPTTEEPTTEEPKTEEPTTEEPTTEEPTTEEPTTEAPTTEAEDDEPETTPTTVAPTTTAPETTVPETSVPETTAVQLVVYRDVEIPQEILDEYPGYTPEELWEMGVLGAFFEKLPTGVLPATGDFSAFWMAMTVLFGVSLAAVTLLDRKRDKK